MGQHPRPSVVLAGEENGAVGGPGDVAGDARSTGKREKLPACFSVHKNGGHRTASSAQSDRHAASVRRDCGRPGAYGHPPEAFV
jgi:hypothetical protein